ncbi:hypothetical protein [Flavihumibacter fluvii]|uniref:hypothetical protein n=1 Tax=Flavihumibacter fluvii TaxID=2838157 RepID=UPI001BDEE941|nr:hypothetical protein [Flavihumibacter fluvii]ULQ52145.1 hypothetical protein KJS93_18805 [Flavihumibacter fluvii]
MAKTNRNFLTFNYVGKVGKQYSLRNRGDQSIIASLPKKARRPLSAQELSQQAVKDNFQRAVLYAKSVRANNPDLMAQYEAVRKGTQSAFNVAFLDAYKGPKLRDLRTDEYEGAPGNPIKVEALDNFRVKSVKFTLFSPDGTRLEEGEGTQAESGFQWTYTAQVANPAVTGTKLRITAKDIPDNMTVLEVLL